MTQTHDLVVHHRSGPGFSQRWSYKSGLLSRFNYLYAWVYSGHWQFGAWLVARDADHLFVRFYFNGAVAFFYLRKQFDEGVLVLVPAGGFMHQAAGSLGGSWLWIERGVVVYFWWFLGLSYHGCVTLLVSSEWLLFLPKFGGRARGWKELLKSIRVQCHFEFGLEGRSDWKSLSLWVDYRSGLSLPR